ncbi:MAG: hypothetical protein LBM23_03830 [Propionibacteriaceae bacterium]|nr:hypothetical protein [Propionibacteriaceae bacterium]
MRGSLTRRALALTVAAVAAFGLTGCSSQEGVTNAAVAAEVGDTVIFESDINEMAQGIDTVATELGILEPTSTLAGLRVTALQYRIQGVLTDAIVSEAGLTITDEDRADMAVLTGWDAYYQRDETKEWVRGNLDLNIIAQRAQAGELTEEQLVAALETNTVEVNPRYGSWNTASWTLTGTGSLSEGTVFSASGH